MNTTIKDKSPSARLACAASLTAVITFAAIHTVPNCRGQGTLNITFDTGSAVAPPGSMIAISQYSEAGVTFYNPNGPNNLITSGGGVNGYPDDGTAYLLCPPGASLAFAFTSPTYFGLATLDLAAYSASQTGPFSLDVVGHGQMGLMVTNTFTVDTLPDRRANHLSDFQTFTLDSTFQHIFRVDFLGPTFALDNVAISGVPEPSAFAIAATAVCCAFAHRRITRSKKPQTPKR